MSASIISGGSTAPVLSGTTLSGAVVLSGGTLAVLPGGTATSATVLNGGWLLVSGGVASGTMLSSGASEAVCSGGTGVADIISAGGYEIVSVGGTAIDSVIEGGTAFIQIEASISGAQVGQGTLVVSGGAAIDTVVSSGGFLMISAGEELGGVISGGTEIARDFALGATRGGLPVLGFDLVEAGGTQIVYQGSAFFATIADSGVQILGGGGAYFTNVDSGGTQVVGASSVATDDVVASGGVVSLTGELAFDNPFGTELTLGGELVGNGVIVESGGGTLVLAAGVASGFDDPGFDGALSIAGGTVVLTSAGAAGSGSIGFAAGTSGTLVIDGTAMPGNTISGLAGGDAIDLAGVAFDPAASVKVSGTTVTISTGGSVFLLTIAGAGGDGTFSLAAADDGSTLLTDTVHSTNVSSGSTMVVSSGAVDSRLVALSGGSIVVLAGGTALSAAVLGGGAMLVSGGLAAGTVLSSGASETITARGIGRAEAISAGASETVSAGGTTSAAIIAGGTELLMSASVASGTVIRGGELLLSGGHAAASTIAGGGFLVVSSGLAAGDVVSGGTEIVQTLLSAKGLTSAVVSGSLIEAGGYEYIYEGAASGVSVAASGTQIVAGGSASATRIGSGGSQIIMAGGIAVNDTVVSGGAVINDGQLRFAAAAGSVIVLGGTLAGSGAIVQAGGGTLTLAASVSSTFDGPGFTGALSIASGTVEITSAGGAGAGVIGFAAGGSGTLKIDGTAMPANVISGFAKGDVIDLAGVAFARPASASVSGNTVTISLNGSAGALGGARYVLTIAGAAQDGPFTLAEAPDGSTVLTDSSTTSSVASGVTASVSAGVVADEVAVLSGGTLVVLAGGTASATVVSSGGSEVVADGGLAIGDAISAGGFETVSAGGSTASGVIGGGTELLETGGSAIAATVVQGSLVVSGGVASATSVGSGGFLLVSAGAAAYSVINGGTEIVRDLASALFPAAAPLVVSDLVESGGAEYLEQGAALDATVGAGGLMVVEGGSAIATAVGSGGTQIVSRGAVATNDLVADGGTVELAGELDFTDFAGGMITLGGRLTGSGVILQSGAGDVVLAADVGSAVGDAGFGGALSIADGTLELSSAGAAGSGAIGFAAGSIGTLAIDGTIMPANTIFDIALGDAIDLHDIFFSSAAQVSVTGGNVLTVSEPGGTIEQLQLDPAENLSHLFFGLAREAAGAGTVITTTDPPCYCRGTRILTATGEVAVEHLAIGDRVVTWAGTLAPIVWIGRRSYPGRQARGRSDVLPIRIRAGALADGVPHRDLFVSPRHALFLDGYLVPAGALENGATIGAEEDWALIDYIHVELAHHAVIWAEGAAAESFVDDRSRAIFANAADHAAGDPPGPAVYCAPRLEAGPRLQDLRRRLARRAGLPGPRLRGFLDVVSCAGLQGWAQNPDHPESPVCLDIVIDGALAARTLADRYRPDLAQAGLGSGRHAFDVTLPEPARDGQAGVMEVRRSSDGAPLGRSPWRPGA